MLSQRVIVDLEPAHLRNPVEIRYSYFALFLLIDNSAKVKCLLGMGAAVGRERLELDPARTAFATEILRLEDLR